jgi:hypothetical protein
MSYWQILNCVQWRALVGTSVRTGSGWPAELLSLTHRSCHVASLLTLVNVLFLKKLVVGQLVKKFSVLCVTRKLIYLLHKDLLLGNARGMYPRMADSNSAEKLTVLPEIPCGFPQYFDAMPDNTLNGATYVYCQVLCCLLSVIHTAQLIS